MQRKCPVCGQKWDDDDPEVLRLLSDHVQEDLPFDGMDRVGKLSFDRLSSPPDSTWDEITNRDGTS
jgi:hypothetical protein